jgi:hypothetical protein
MSSTELYDVLENVIGNIDIRMKRLTNATSFGTHEEHTTQNRAEPKQQLLVEGKRQQGLYSKLSNDRLVLNKIMSYIKNDTDDDSAVPGML